MADSSIDPFQNSGFQSSFQSQPNPASNDRGAAAPAAASGSGDNDSYVPRPKRIACVVCRRRKLKCDGKKPSCGTCSRLGHTCAYDEVRKKSGPKRGYVKQLEARLAQVEILLNGQEQTALPTHQTQSQTQPQENAFDAPIPNDIADISDMSALADDMGISISPAEAAGQPQPGQGYLPETGFNTADDSAWEMLSLGLEEPLPAQGVIDELNQIFFDKIYPSMPIIHRPRYLAASNLAPNLRPPVYLQYIVWCHAASVSDKYYHLHGHFYQRARKYAEMEEMKGLGESILSLAYCQAWLAIGTYEFRMLYFPRAWLSTGKCMRLALMMGLNRLDGVGLDVKQSLSPPKDWTEREERRRVFWLTFCCDRYASIGTSWPMMIDERDIMTNLPATEEAFTKSKPLRTLRLEDVLAGDGTSTLSPFGSVVLLASLLGRNLTHLHRPDPQDNDYDLNGEFWKRHRSYDNILLNIALQLPNHLRLPAGMNDPNVIFCNMCIHTSTICLHQAAIFKAEKNKMPDQIITESKRRCIVAADQISSIMKLISHIDLTLMNPFLSFCVYVAARIFVQYLKWRPDDPMVQSSLQFVISALRALKNKNPLTETFLVQLEVDTKGMGVQSGEKPSKRGRFECGANTGVSACASDVAECPAFLGLPQSPANDAVETPPQDRDSFRDHLNQHPAASLPSRRKQNDTQQVNLNVSGAMQDFIGTPLNLNPGTESAPGPAINMNGAPNFSLGSINSNPPSDHSTLSTRDSSSNISYQRTGHPSPQKSQQQSSTTQVPLNPLDISSAAAATAAATGGGITDPNQFNDPSSLARQLSSNHPETPFYTTGADNTSFSISSPSTWDFSNPQAQAQTQASVPNPGGMTPGTTVPFSEAQLAQILSATNWDAWRG